MDDMGNHMRFQALRVIDDSTVEYSFITDDQQTVQHVFTSPPTPGSIRVLHGDEAWIDAYGRVPGPPIWFRRRWPYGLAGLALEANRQALPIGQPLADITAESRHRLKEEWESGGHNLESEDVLLRLTHEQALVLDAFLSRGQSAGDNYGTFEDQAELRVIWDIAAELESSLPVVNNEEYVEQLAAARAKVRDSTE